MTRRPTRTHKFDRLVTPDASAEMIRCDMMLAPFDARASELDRYWGINRLPELVSLETADKYGSALGKLNAAMNANDPEETKLRAAVCIRGLNAMDAEAKAAGHSPLPPDVWEIDLDGETVCILRDARDWLKLAEMRPGVKYHSLREVAVALKYAASGKMYDAVREKFPQAELVKIEKRKMEFNDDVPF